MTCFASKDSHQNCRSLPITKLRKLLPALLLAQISHYKNTLPNQHRSSLKHLEARN